MSEQSREELLKALKEKEWKMEQMQRSIEQMTETIKYLEDQCKLGGAMVNSLHDEIQAYQRRHERDQEKKASLRRQRSELALELKTITDRAKKNRG
ncbi:hypothetical protein BKA81DRAFT_434952 [Phyllosticta paracitricarpa]